MESLARYGCAVLLVLAPTVAGCQSSSSPSESGGTTRVGSLQSGGLRRSYWLQLPQRARQRMPVLIVFHGAGGTGSSMMSLFDADVIERYGFLAVYPEAASGTHGTWALGCAQCTWADAAGVDDYRFARDLIDTLARRHDIDRSRVFVAGHSLGGSFAFDLACRFSELVAGTAVVASLPSADELPGCRAGRALEVMIVLGDQDANVPWDGGGRYAYASADSSARLWAGWNGCSSAPASSALPDRNGDGRLVRATTYSSCRDGVHVRLFRVENGGHGWPRDDLDASNEIVRSFFGAAPN